MFDLYFIIACLIYCSLALRHIINHTVHDDVFTFSKRNKCYCSLLKTIFCYLIVHLNLSVGNIIEVCVVTVRFLFRDYSVVLKKGHINHPGTKNSSKIVKIPRKVTSYTFHSIICHVLYTFRISTNFP